MDYLQYKELTSIYPKAEIEVLNLIINGLPSILNLILRTLLNT